MVSGLFPVFFLPKTNPMTGGLVMKFAGYVFNDILYDSTLI